MTDLSSVSVEALAEKVQEGTAWGSSAPARNLADAALTELVRRAEERDEAVKDLTTESVFADENGRRADAAEARVDTLTAALERIVSCDFRGNEPPEQAIARAALAEVKP